MMALQSKPLDQAWKELFDLHTRKVPEFYEHADDVTGSSHADAIRTAFEEMDLSAVFCVQDVPTIAFLSVNVYDREQIVDLHAALWNQGLANLLLVLSDTTVRAFSLARIPYSGENLDFESRCLVRELNTIADALELKDIVYGADSGRLWEAYPDYFRLGERIDQVLLNNLTESQKQLRAKGLSPDAAQALLIQVMFIAYLEDREIIDQEDFQRITNEPINSFSELLELADDHSLVRLFDNLRQDFNGDLFVAPCSFEETNNSIPLTHSHLTILSRFHSGRMHMDSGQYRFWGYNFKYIPIELISAVYDRFLKECESDQRYQGAYYTPMFLADTVISQLWDNLSPEIRASGHFLDPACGSGIFLVRSFQRLCEYWRESKNDRTIPWNNLLAILSRMRGWDINGSAVHVAVFSLYLALLEEVSPPQLRELKKQGKILPALWGRNLRKLDFFDSQTDAVKVDVIIGNPPWSSRHGSVRSSIGWCNERQFPIPVKEDAWAFVWKSLQHLRPNGTIAFLLPAMGFLHNHARSTVSARKRFMYDARIFRIINFADLRYQLFPSAVRPAALIVFGSADQAASAYRFDYWTPKADLNLKTRRLITLSNADKCIISTHMADEDPRIFKKRLWMSAPEEKLFNYLSKLPKLAGLVTEYDALKHKSEAFENKWIIGQGFKPANTDRLSDRNYRYQHSTIVGTTPYLPTANLRSFFDYDQLSPWKNSAVHRKGFEKGFEGPRILIPRGISTRHMRLRATYFEKPLTFQDSVQAIVCPRGEERRAKLLAALLNSKMALWFTFHGTASFGSERPELKQSELLNLPFPSPNDMPAGDQSLAAADGLVAWVDKTTWTKNRAFSLQANQNEIFSELDRLVYDYFCLSDTEIMLINDTVEKVIPAIQPRQRSFPEIWKPSNYDDRQNYAMTLIHDLTDWFEDGWTVGVRLIAHNNDLALLCLSLQSAVGKPEYVEDNDVSVGKALANLSNRINQPLVGNFQLLPDFRLFIGNELYLVKPLQKRFWLSSAAIADADAIALDLNDIVKPRNHPSYV